MTLQRCLAQTLGTLEFGGWHRTKLQANMARRYLPHLLHLYWSMPSRCNATVQLHSRASGSGYLCCALELMGLHVHIAKLLGVSSFNGMQMQIMRTHGL